MDSADGAVGALLALGGEVAVVQVVTVEALVAVDVRGTEDRNTGTWKATQVYFVWGEPGRSVDGVVLGGLDVRQECMPVLLLFIASHGIRAVVWLARATPPLVQGWYGLMLTLLMPRRSYRA